MKITIRTVDAAQPTGKDHVLWDSDLRGFGLKITGAGSKVYVLQYRMGGRGNPTRRHTIGNHDSPWTPATARAEAQRLLQLVRSGVDPRLIDQERRREERELRFDHYVERFLELYARRKWRKGTILSHESNFRRWVVPVLKSKPLPSITRRDVTAVFDKLPATSPALPRNLFALLRRLFSWAVERGDVEVSPMNGMKAPSPPASRDRILSDDEITIIAACTDELGAVWGPFFRLLILTGQRRTEVAALSWEELDRAQHLWILPPERVKNKRSHTIPLSDLVIAEFDALAGSDRWPTDGYVFTHTGSTAVSGFSRTKARLDRIVARVTEPGQVRAWRPHDLRRTVATNLQRLGVRFEVTEAILNHVSTTQSGVAGVYMRHDWAGEKRDALQGWADRLKEMVLDHAARLNA